MVKRKVKNMEGTWLIQIGSFRGHNEEFRRVVGRELGKTGGIHGNMRMSLRSKQIKDTLVRFRFLVVTDGA